MAVARRNLLLAGPGSIAGIAIRRIVAAAADVGIVIEAALADTQTLNLSGTTAYTLPTHTDGSLLVTMLAVDKPDLTLDEIRLETGGWVRVSALDQEGVGGNARTSKMYTKFASGEGATIDIINDTAIGYTGIVVTIAVSGVHADKFDVTPVDAHAQDDDNTNTPQAPAITSISNKAAMIIFNQLASDNFSTFGVPAGYADDAKNSDAAGSGWVSSKIVPVAGLETPGVWTPGGVPTSADHLNTSIMLKPGAVAAPNPTFSNVTFLMGANGTDGATDFTDDSEDARTITVVNDTQKDTAEKKYGTASALFDGTADELTVPDSNDFEFDQVMTVECFVRFNTLSGALQTLIGKRNSGTARGWIIYKHFISSTSVINCQGFNEGASAFSISSTDELKIDTWYHIALVREASGLVSLYIDGALQASATEGSTSNTNTEPMRMGFDESIAGGRPLDGHLDEVRVTTSEAVYTAPFIPPLQEFPRA